MSNNMTELEHLIVSTRSEVTALAAMLGNDSVSPYDRGQFQLLMNSAQTGADKINRQILLRLSALFEGYLQGAFTIKSIIRLVNLPDVIAGDAAKLVILYETCEGTPHDTLATASNRPLDHFTIDYRTLMLPLDEFLVTIIDQHKTDPMVFYFGEASIVNITGVV